MDSLSLFSIGLAGFAAGAVHVVTGPDHLAAVAPLAIQENKRPWILGLKWGLGHASGVVLVAVFAWLLRETLRVEVFSSHCERLVGLMLIAIGIWGLRRAFGVHAHPHRHPADHPTEHTHLHLHAERDHRSHTHAALGVGILHGLAGASHFLGVLPALAMPTRTAAAVYLVLFGTGTIVSMSGFSFLIGNVGSRLAHSGLNYFRGIAATLSTASIALGIFWIAH
ncbi:MAG TPA: sulfite exporter TauE/SafE family protein [Bdellovibrionota bacterium]|nr:sulfite exporter TauE/SafE family protein [Bdellovibrionota bacterium]